MAVSTIAPRLPFADTLAAGLLERTAEDPTQLARMTVLLPTRRAQRTLREAFLRQSEGQPLMLPRMVALGDLDEDDLLFSGFQGLAGEESAASAALHAIPPAIPPLRRRLLLTRLVMAKGDETGAMFTPDQAVRLADELARLLDQVHTEGSTLSALGPHDADRFAAHWENIAQFLQILSIAWPNMLAEEGCLDPADRRNRVLRAQAEAWMDAPPLTPVIAAGITGSVPAAAELLAVVADLPAGEVVLPGLDLHLDEDSWQSLDESHPQHALRRLLQVMALDRSQIQTWDAQPLLAEDAALAHPAREQLVSEMMRPARTSHLWRTLPEHPNAPSAFAVDGLSRLDCPTQREEALSIALIMRGALETAERTVALVTPDRDLSRRVASELGRWGIRVDDSAGRPLAVTPPGAFLRLTAAMIAEQFAPVALLAALKHPLAGAGMDPAIFRDAVRRLDIHVLRGVRPAAGLEGVRAALRAAEKDRIVHPSRYGRTDLDGLEALLDAVESCCAPLTSLISHESDPDCSFEDLLESHLQLAEALAATDAMPGPLRLWAEDAGDVAATWARDLADCAAIMGPLAPQRYASLLDVLMGGIGVRQEFGSHPRLAILGPMEARLRHADVVIVGGLNEDVWPPRVAVDPWVSRPMRFDAGLPQPEQRIGHAAHDLSCLLCAPQVILTRAAKVDGTPTVASRWLLRLDTVLKALTLPALGPEDPWVRWAQTLDQVDSVTPIERPAPRPPVIDRPTRLSVTKIETWMRDPYAIYAQYMLGLKALNALDEAPGASDYGTLVHGALEMFHRTYPDALPDAPLTALLACGKQVFDDHIARPSVWAFWWPRFEQLAAWVVEQEQQRRPLVRSSAVEIKGETVIDGLTLTAEADRIDLMHDGSVAIIDYKTGTPPPAKEVAAGFAPQLPLEALIAIEGGFPGIPKGREVSELAFWKLSGGKKGGEIVSALAKKSDLSTTDLAEQARVGVKGLIDAFSRQETPYLSRPHPEHAPKYSDYQHLARVREWSAGEGDGE